MSNENNWTISSTGPMGCLYVFFVYQIITSLFQLLFWVILPLTFLNSGNNNPY